TVIIRRIRSSPKRIPKSSSERSRRSACASVHTGNSPLGLRGFTPSSWSGRPAPEPLGVGVLAQVVDEHWTQGLAELAVAAVECVGDQSFERLHVVVGLADVSARRLGGRDRLQQRPQEPDVEVLLGAADRPIVELLRGKLLELLGHVHSSATRRHVAGPLSHQRRLRRPARRDSGSMSRPLPLTSSLPTSLRSSARSLALSCPSRPCWTRTRSRISSLSRARSFSERERQRSPMATPACSNAAHGSAFKRDPDGLIFAGSRELSLGTAAM